MTAREGATNQARNLVGAAAHAALQRFAEKNGVGGARQHRVLGGHPALTFALKPARHALGKGCGAQHAGVAELDEGGTLSVAGPAAGNGDGAQLVEGRDRLRGLQSWVLLESVCGICVCLLNLCRKMGEAERSLN